jgi:3-hydroxyisobutyrate dehydrogenase-like beta-hydroxyacid dehydrogenase
MRTRVAVIGVGLMGSSLAKHLVAAGFPVTVHDVDPAKVDALVKLGATKAAAPERIPREVDVVMLSLPNSHAVDEVLFDTLGLPQTGRRGLVVVDCSTPLADARRSQAVGRVLERDGPERRAW